MPVRIITGDCKEALANMAAESVHCVVTSPPYWGLRDYGVDGQLGLESSPDEYITSMVDVFREVRRVLRDDGTVWLNVGDSYSHGGNGSRDAEKWPKQSRNDHRVEHAKKYSGFKSKDLLMIPARLALALQSDGWWLRSEIVWSKPNPMPESVTDRPTSAHEKIFLLAKSQRYFFDADAVREGAEQSGWAKQRAKGEDTWKYGRTAGDNTTNGVGGTFGDQSTRNIRNVWTVATQPFSDAHFATFPPALIEPCIKAGTSEKGCCPKCGAPWWRQTNKSPAKDGIERGKHPSAHRANTQSPQQSANGGLGTRYSETIGWQPSCACYPPIEDAPDCFVPRLEPATVLDPFGGAGTTGLVADRLGRNAILIELNPEYAEMAQRRIENDAGLFAEVTTNARSAL